MNDRVALLVEIRTLELPPAQVWELAQNFPDLLLAALRQHGFADTQSRRAPQLLATPRRFAAVITDVLARGADVPFVKKGPKLSAAYADDNGNKKPTAALRGFMRSLGIDDPTTLTTVTEKNNNYIAFEGVRRGEALADTLADTVETVLRNVNAPRLMRWGSHAFKFIRPLTGVTMLADSTPILSGRVFGIAPGKNSVGHTVTHPQPVAITHPRDYEKVLSQNGVMADIEQRRQHIRAELNRDTLNETLLNEVSALCEMPFVECGEFDRDFLTLPAVCIDSCLSKHQRAFALYEKGKLQNIFHYITDNRPRNPQAMRDGYNRVLRARLCDIRFYFEEDKKHTAEAMSPKLAAITYHRRLGSQAQRVERLVCIAESLSRHLELPKATAEQLVEAARLCKLDLATAMIGEYPELEGVMAAIYFCPPSSPLFEAVRLHNARHWRDEIRDNDNNNDSILIYLLLITNHIEKCMAMFGVGETVSGSKDPHGLRFCAASIADALLQLSPPLALPDLIDLAAGAFDGLPPATQNAVADFIAERKKQELLAAGADKNIINAVSAKRVRFMSELIEKTEALTTVRAEGMDDLIRLNKRVGNILRKSEAADAADTNASPNTAKMQTAEEKNLHKAVQEYRDRRETLLQAHNYADAWRALQSLIPPCDAFFEQVLVNAPEDDIRRNRLALLTQLHGELTAMADLSEL